MLRSALHWATLSLALGTLLWTACGDTNEGDDDGGGTSGQAGTSPTGGGAGTGGASGGSAGSSTGKGGTSSGGGGSSGSDNGGSENGGSENGGSENGGTPAAGGSDAGSSGAGAPAAGSGGSSEMNDCDPRKITCRRAAPVCDEGEAPSVEGTCYGPCVPIASCACSSAEACPLPEMFTCHLSRGRCDYYVR